MSLVEAVSAERLLAHLKALEGERHPFSSPQRLAAAMAYVRHQWLDAGLEVTPDPFVYEGVACFNLVAVPPEAPAHPRLLIGAHVDTVEGTPGADDNASGVAAMLEASRVLAASRFSGAVEWIAFTLEEYGMVGSSHYVQQLRRQHRSILGMLSLEMVGFTESQGLQRYPEFLEGRYPVTGTYLGLAANGPSKELLGRVADAMRRIPGLPVETIAIPGDGGLIPEARLSDHAPFWDGGHPALLVTDTALFRNPHYHQATDTVSTLDLSFLTKITQGIVRTVEEIEATFREC